MAGMNDVVHSCTQYTLKCMSVFLSLHPSRHRMCKQEYAMPGTLLPSPLPPEPAAPSPRHHMVAMSASRTTARRLWEAGMWETSILRPGDRLAVDVAQWRQILEMPPKQPEMALSLWGGSGFCVCVFVPTVIVKWCSGATCDRPPWWETTLHLSPPFPKPFPSYLQEHEPMTKEHPSLLCSSSIVVQQSWQYWRVDPHSLKMCVCMYIYMCVCVCVCVSFVVYICRWIL